MFSLDSQATILECMLLASLYLSLSRVRSYARMIWDAEERFSYKAESRTAACILVHGIDLGYVATQMIQ